MRMSAPECSTSQGRVAHTRWRPGRSRDAPAGGNRHGYAGYEFEPVTAYAIWLVRNRVLNSDFGRWKRRDRDTRLGNPDAYRYSLGDPINRADFDGNMSLRIRPIKNTKGPCGRYEHNVWM